MSIIDLIAKGNINGFAEIPQMIETTVSYIFIFKNAHKVLKIYRRDNEYWNTNFTDISRGEERSRFICEDFVANKAANSLVYIDLQKATIHNDTVILEAKDDESDELVIIMNYIEASQSFIDTLFYKDILDSDFESIGKQFAIIKKNIKTNEIKPMANWHELLSQRVLDLKGWMKDLYFPEKVMSECIQKLTIYIEKNKERFRSIRNDALAYSIDGHGENALYNEGRLQFIDILWPMARWRWTPKEYDIFRLGADIFAFTGEKNFTAYLDGAKKIFSDFDETDKDFYLVYSAALDGCVLETLTKSKPTKKQQQEKYYKWFLERLHMFDPDHG